MKPVAIVRVILIAFGIASATLLARSAFGFRFNEDFVRFLDLVGSFIALGTLPFEVLFVDPVARWLHDLGFVFQLYPHWHYAFVLLWLFSAAFTRASAPPSKFLEGGANGNGVTIGVFRWVWAALTALLGGALAGTVPLNDPAVLWWPAMAHFLYVGGDDLFNVAGGSRDSEYKVQAPVALLFAAVFAAFAVGWLRPPAIEGHPPAFWWVLTAYFAYRSSAYRELGFFIACLAFAVGYFKGPEWLNFEQSPSPGLANLAAFVVGLAAFYVLRAFLWPAEGERSYLERVFSEHAMRTAIDVFTVLGGAAIITYLARLMA